MQPGLDWREEYVDGDASDVIPMLNGVTDMSLFAASKPAVCSPGTLFNYSSGTTNIISDILTCALCPDDIDSDRKSGKGCRTGEERKAAFSSFFDYFAKSTLQCSFVAPKFDKAGTFVGSSWLYSSARNFARLAFLYMSDGVWGGTRLLPDGWAASASAWSGVDAMGQNYGSHFWLDIFVNKASEAAIVQHTYSCNGFEGQFTIAVPEHDLIIVRLGKSEGGDSLQKDSVIATLTEVVEELAQQAHTKARL